MITTFADAVILEWQKLVREEIASSTVVVLESRAVPTLEEYKRRVGEISGLMKSLDLLNEAREIVSKRD